MSKPKKLYVAGRTATVTVANLSGSKGDCEAFGYDGEVSYEDAIIKVRSLDDATLSHELGHLIARSRGIYLSEAQMGVLEELFTVLRDPRNAWLLDYYGDYGE